MKTLKISIISIFLLSIMLPIPLAAQDAGKILENMDKIFFSATDKQGTVTIILTDKSGKEKVREASMMQKGSDKKLYRYTKPDSQAGVSTLSLPGDITWLYMPAFGKPKKISLLAKSQSFTGTDFSYEDMLTTPYSERYTAELLATEKDAYVLQLNPISDKSSYSKIVVNINKTYGYPNSMQFYNNKGKNFKEAKYRYEKIGKYWNAAEVLMTDLEKNHSTKILLTDIKFDQGLSDDVFSVDSLKP